MLPSRKQRFGLFRFTCKAALLTSIAVCVPLPGNAEQTSTVPYTAFLSQIALARQRASSCGQGAPACDTTGLPGREQVQGGANGSFLADWSWFRDALSAAKDTNPAERAKRMSAAQDHLDELAREAGAPTNPHAAADFQRASLAAKAALARDEFRAADGPSWMERQIAKAQDWLLRLFTGMDRLGRKAPWLAPAIEWGCFGLAAAGLLWFVRRNLARHALRISLTEGAALAMHGGRDSADWATLARERAAAEDWREAVHCLYWAAIALMETRRIWKPNAARTPRDYLRLLEPGSGPYTALRAMTRAFERTWYGHEPTGPAEYQKALEHFQALEAARPARVSADSRPDIPPPAAVPSTGGL